MGDQKIISMGDTAQSPKTILHQALERANEMEGVVVLMLLKESPREVEPLWSSMIVSDLVFAEKALHMKVDQVLTATMHSDEEDEDPTG
jgi:hypothetical protein